MAGCPHRCCLTCCPGIAVLNGGAGLYQACNRRRAVRQGYTEGGYLRGAWGDGAAVVLLSLQINGLGGADQGFCGFLQTMIMLRLV
ncbi:hypothetical protein SAMN03159444_03697 [Pseudomonas sp. NFACC02]|nr:hypothetical protein SAMN03159444_03697 [Pseudomonas sp. NFACC02]